MKVNRGKFYSFLIISTLIMLIIIFFLSSGCKAKATEEVVEESTEEIQETEEELKEDANKEDEELEETATDKEVLEEDSSKLESDDESSGEAEEEAEEIPAEITDLISSADNYFSSGEYSLAVKEYRNAEIAINDSDLPEDSQQELISSFSTNYDNASDITSIARAHYGNAKKLQYEKRYEEAKQELEAALAIYPKYQEALDALATLKSLMGLSQ